MRGAGSREGRWGCTWLSRRAVNALWPRGWQEGLRRRHAVCAWQECCYRLAHDLMKSCGGRQVMWDGEGIRHLAGWLGGIGAVFGRGEIDVVRAHLLPYLGIQKAGSYVAMEISQVAVDFIQVPLLRTQSGKQVEWTSKSLSWCQWCFFQSFFLSLWLTVGGILCKNLYSLTIKWPCE